MKIPAPTRPITAVKISIIGRLPLRSPAHANQTTRRPTQSKTFRGTSVQSASTGDSVQQMCPDGAAHGVAGVARKQRSVNHRKPHPISALFRLRYLQQMMRRWAASTQFPALGCVALGTLLVEW